MKKNLLCLLLALAILLSLVACGSFSTSSVEETVSESAAASEVESVEEVTEEPVVEPVAKSVEEPAEEPEPEPEPEEAPVVIEYPISDGSVTFTFWNEMLGLFSSEMAEWNDNICKPYAEEATGIHEDIITVSDTAAREQFSLMIASGDWPDFVNAAQYYTGGLAQAYADDVIIEITEEQMDEHMPDYQSYWKQWNQATVEYTHTNGMTLSIYQIFSDAITDRGVVLRNDWLDALGLAAPKNLDEFTNVLESFHQTYNCTYTYDVGAGAQLQYLNDAFDTNIPDITNTDLNVYVTDGEIRTPFNDDGYRAYVEWFADLYSKGVFNPDFSTEGAHMGPSVYALVAGGDCGLWETCADSILDPNSMMEPGQELDPVAIGMIVGEDGFNNWATSPLWVKEGGLSITASCQNPELLMEYFNYFFTEPGILLANYGIEGVTFNYDKNGKPVYTEKITKPEKLNFTNAINVFTAGSLVPFWADMNRYWDYYDETVVAAKDVWSDISNSSVDHEYPNGASLTSEETNSITLRVVDIMTYASEQLLKFLTGAEPVTDQSWGAYVDTIESMGISDCMAVYQNAYDEYLAGNR